MSVRDFGKGIAGHIVELRPGSVGIGLGGMRQRAKEFGGELRLKNADPGTLIEVTIPLKVGDSEVRATQAVSAWGSLVSFVAWQRASGQE